MKKGVSFKKTGPETGRSFGLTRLCRVSLGTPLLSGGGFTVIEIVVALGVATVILFLTTTSFVQVAYRSLVGLSDESQAQLEATANLDRIGRYLRQTEFLVGANGQSVVFMAFASEGATISSKMRFFLSGRNLLQGVIPPSGIGPDYTYNPADETFYTLTGKISTSSAVIFTYYDADGALLASPVATGSVTLVGVDLPYKPDRSLRPAPLNFVVTIQLRNRKTNL